VPEGQLQGNRKTEENAIELVLKMKGRNMDYNQPKELAQDRSNWRQ